jgi:hypothetical protein
MGWNLDTRWNRASGVPRGQFFTASRCDSSGYGLAPAGVSALCETETHAR